MPTAPPAPNVKLGVLIQDLRAFQDTVIDSGNYDIPSDIRTLTEQLVYRLEQWKIKSNAVATNDSFPQNLSAEKVNSVVNMQFGKEDRSGASALPASQRRP
jgi:hypothetical protein